MKKHILCLGDSNTHGYCADIKDSEDGCNRFNENERWTCLLQKKLGDDYSVTEEGLSGRTTVFKDPLHEGMDAFSSLYPMLKSHEPLDLLIIMLGTNDTKERFNADAKIIACGMDRLIKKAKTTDCWGNHPDKILLICPPPIRNEFKDILEGEFMGSDCVRKSIELAAYYKKTAEQNNCMFLNAKDCEFNRIDCMHLTRQGHRQLADLIAPVVISSLT